MVDQAITAHPPLPIRANFTWNFAGKMAYAGARALILVLIAKLGSAAMVGQYALAFAVTTPVFMLADLDLRSVLATDTKNKLEFGHYLGLRFISMVLAMVAVCVLALLQSDRQTALVIIFVGAAKGIESISDILFGLMQKNERLDKLGVSLMIKGLLSLVVMGLLLWKVHSLVLGAAGLAVAWLLVLLCYDIPTAWSFEPVRMRLSPRVLWPLMKLSLPLGVVLLFASLNKNMSNYFIEAFHGAEALGYFSSILYIMATGSLVVSALSQSANTRLARLFSQGDTAGFSRFLAQITAIAMGLGACMLLAAAVGGRQILTLLYRPEYVAWTGVFVLVMGVSGLSYASEIMASALTSARKFKIQPMVSGGVLLAGFLLNLLIVPKMGLTGAALCILATTCLQLAGSLAVLIREVQKRAAETKQQVSAGAADTSAPALTVEQLPSIDHLTAETLSIWQDLLVKNSNDCAFAEPDWLAAWWRFVGVGQEPLLLAVRDKEAIVALFPLMISRGHGLKRVSFMGTSQASHMGVACLPEYQSRAAEALLGCLLGMKGIAIANLTGLRAESGFSLALGKLLKASRTPCLKSRAPSPVIHAKGLDFAALCKSRFSPHAAKNNRRDEARLSALGKVSFREMTAQDMDDAFALHDMRWRKKLDTSGFTDGPSRHLFAQLLGIHSRWQTLALGLFLDERLIAFQYGFISRGRALLYKSAHDDLFGIFAPGKMMKREYIRRCLALGVDTIDLGIGYEEYKAEWTNDQETNITLSFPNKNVFSRILFAADYAKGTLRNRLKRSRRIVLFKRNTLGWLRFWLSPRHLVEALGRAWLVANRRGFLRLLLGYFSPGQTEELALREPVCDQLDIHCKAQQAAPGDAAEVSLLMNCVSEEVIRRIYRQDRCYVVRQGDVIACVVWLGRQAGRVVISDFCMDRRLCCEQDIAQLLRGIVVSLPDQERTGAVLKLNRHFGMAIGAARKVGFGVSTADIINRSFDLAKP